MRRIWAIGLPFGIALLAATMMYVGAGAVVRALHGLQFSGLLLLVGLHLPVVAVMGLAWRLVAGRAPGASRVRFVWARLVRDAAAEVLPFSQIGAFVFGLRALRLPASGTVRGALSMSIDLVIELAAKVPYVLAGLLALLTLAAGSGLVRPVAYVLALTATAVAIPLLGRRQLGGALEALARLLARRWPVMASDDGVESGYRINSTLDGLLHQRSRWQAGFALHLGAWLYGAAELWATFALLGHRVSPLQALTIDSVVAGLRSFAFAIPMAAGVQEASYALVCTAFGIAPAVAVAASLARRARDLTLGSFTLLLVARAESRARDVVGSAEQWRSRSRG